jgi:hypothetical protein
LGGGGRCGARAEALLGAGAAAPGPAPKPPPHSLFSVPQETLIRNHNITETTAKRTARTVDAWRRSSLSVPSDERTRKKKNSEVTP